MAIEIKPIRLRDYKYKDLVIYKPQNSSEIKNVLENIKHNKVYCAAIKTTMFIATSYKDLTQFVTALYDEKLIKKEITTKYLAIFHCYNNKIYLKEDSDIRKLRGFVLASVKRRLVPSKKED